MQQGGGHMDGYEHVVTGGHHVKTYRIWAFLWRVHTLHCWDNTSAVYRPEHLIQKDKNRDSFVLWRRNSSPWMNLSEKQSVLMSNVAHKQVRSPRQDSFQFLVVLVQLEGDWRLVWMTDWQLFWVSSWKAALLEVVLHACTVCLRLCVTLRSVRARSPHCLCCSPCRCSPPSDIWRNLGIIQGKSIQTEHSTKKYKIQHSLLFLHAESKV